MNFIKKYEKSILFIAVSFFSLIYISLVWNNNVWMDEAFTASLVHTDFAHVIERSMADTLPPLYNILLKLATSLFGYSVPVMKITSVVPMILTLILGATVVKKRFGLRTGILFMMFITFMPLVLYYGVEIRMYSLGFFFATGSGIYAYEVVSSPSRKNWTIFTVLSVLAGYSHHFAFVTVAFVYFWLLVYHLFKAREGLKQWLLCLLATFVLYLPCLIITLSQISRVSGYFSMPDVDLKMFIQYALYPYVVGVTAATVLCALVMLSALAMLLYSVVVKKEKDADLYCSACCFSVYYLVLLFGTVISKIMTANIFVDRYLFFSVGLLWLSASIVFAKNGRISLIAAVAAAIVGICSYYVEFRTEYATTADEEISFLRDNIREGDVYFSIGGHEEMQNCIPFYTYLDKETPELTFVYPLETAIEESEARGSTLWISVLDGFEPSDEDIAILNDHGVSMVKKADFEFDRYRCEMYKVEQSGFVKK